MPVRVINIGLENVWLHPRSIFGIATQAELVREKDVPHCTMEASASEIIVQVHKIDVYAKYEGISTFKADIDCKDLPPDIEAKIAAVFMKYRDCFCQDDEDLGLTTLRSHNVPVKIPYLQI